MNFSFGKSLITCTHLAQRKKTKTQQDKNDKLTLFKQAFSLSLWSLSGLTLGSSVCACKQR